MNANEKKQAPPCAKERPILFSAPMVQAILAGRKTQTRRIIKPQPKAHTFDCASLDAAYPDKPWCWLAYWLDEKGDELSSDEAGDINGGWPDCSAQFACPYGKPGDRLWVRETFCPFTTKVYSNKGLTESEPQSVYKADGGFLLNGYKWKPSIHMPRWASRITLEITEVRVQRLQEISDEDAIAEGVEPLVMTEQDVADSLISDEPPHIKELTRLMGPGSFSHKFTFQMLWDDIHGMSAWTANPWVWAMTFKVVKP